MTHITFKDIRLQQLDVARQTNDEMPGLIESLDIGISAILGVLNETAKKTNLADNSGRVKSMSWLWTYKSVFTMAASILSAETGCYAESVSLNRSITEFLVQILYLSRYPGEIDRLPYLSSGRKLPFKKMFEEIAPGYYVRYYRPASEFTHPGWGSLGFKMMRDSAGRESIDQGVIYKADIFTKVFNELTVMVLGFLRTLAILFPTSDWDSDVLHEWTGAINKMQTALDSHIALKGGPNDWHKLSEPLWNPK